MSDNTEINSNNLNVETVIKTSDHVVIVTDNTPEVLTDDDTPVVEITNSSNTVTAVNTGPPGPQGKPGEGLPKGGKANQVLAKISEQDYDTAWVTRSGGEGGAVILNGTTDPSVLDGADGDFYINTTTDTLFGPKNGSNWGSGTSIVGPQGDPGPAGADGQDGDPGPAGADGQDGATILNGTGAPNGLIGNNGDYYINTTTVELFGPKTGGVWPSSGFSLRGTDGTDGATILNGIGAPNTQGTDGDFYIDTHTNTLYGPKFGSNWALPGVSLIGPQGDTGNDGADGADGAPGADGRTILNGVVDPTTEGVDGDFYINTTTNTLFGPKVTGSWGSGIALVGPAGSDGAPGADGNDGLQGAPGIDGQDGLGWTGGSYNAGTGIVTFTSDDGLGFTTGDLRGADGADGIDGQGVPTGGAEGQVLRKASATNNDTEWVNPQALRVPFFSARNSSGGDKSIPNNTWTRVDGSAVWSDVTDNENGFNAATGTYTIPEDGVWQIGGLITLDNVSNGARMVVALYKNNSLYVLLGRGDAGGNNLLGFSGSFVFSAASGDEFDIRVFHASVFNRDTSSQSGYQTFWGHKIGNQSN